MIRILGVHLDSLYATCYGELTNFAAKILPELKAAAQQQKKAEWYPVHELADVAGGTFYVKRSGVSRDYSYVLANSRFRLHICPRAGLRRPAVLIQYRSDLLYEYDLPAIESMTARVVAQILQKGYRIVVSRADLACDFQSPDWKLLLGMFEDVATRAGAGMIHTDPSGRKVTGMTFGKHGGSLQIQIYRKSETLQKDEKQWMFGVWRAESEEFEDEVPVYRVEVRFYRQALRLMKEDDDTGIDSFSDLRESLADLCSYAISGERPYFRICDPEHQLSGDNKQHRRNAPWWEQVKEAFSTVTGSRGRKRKGDRPNYKLAKVRKRIVANVGRYAAILYARGHCRAVEDPIEVAKWALHEEFYREPVEWLQEDIGGEAAIYEWRRGGPRRWMEIVRDKADEYSALMEAAGTPIPSV